MNAIHPSHIMRENTVMNVFNQHVAAFTAGNLEGVLNDFTEQSVVFTPDGVFDGLEKIRNLYQGLLMEFGVINRGDSPGIHIDNLHVYLDTLFITWHAESIQNIFKFGTDTFVIRNGKVLRQSISFPPPVPRQL